MAIDSSLFMVDIPAGTYATGDTVELTIKEGPAVVRSGRGAALLKRLTVGLIGDASGSASYWKISVRNSDWVDDMTSVCPRMFNDVTGLDERSGAIQRGNDCPLTPNSSWKVIAENINGNTTTVDNTLFAIIDVDYPSVSSIIDPDNLPGIPTSIEYATPAAIPLNALGDGATSTFTSYNVDIFKAGYEYALQKVEMYGIAAAGFVALANAAGMAGLQRIMPINSVPQAIRNKVEYATKLVKGPMDIRFMLFTNAATATTGAESLIMDFVKRRV